MAITLSRSIEEAVYPLHPDTALVWLVDLARTASVTSYYALHTESLTYAGNTYSPIQGAVEQIRHGEDESPEIGLALSNADGTIQGYLESGDILNRKTTLRLVSTRHIAIASHEMSVALYALRASCDDRFAAIVLGFWPDQPFPRDRFMRDRCMWTFKDADTCGYSGSVTTCDKSYNSSAGCLGRSNQRRYGGFPHLMTGLVPVLP